MARMRSHYLFEYIPLLAGLASAVALVALTVLDFISDFTATYALAGGSVVALILLARPSPSPLRSFWSRLAARVPAPVPRTN